MRGAKFHGQTDGYYYPDVKHEETADKALQEVARWLRYEDDLAYTDDLDALGRRIFDRARD